VGGWAGEGDGPEERRADGRKAEGGRRQEGRSGSGDAIAEEEEEYCIAYRGAQRAGRTTGHRDERGSDSGGRGVRAARVVGPGTD